MKKDCPTGAAYDPARPCRNPNASVYAGKPLPQSRTAYLSKIWLLSGPIPTIAILHSQSSSSRRI